MEKEIKFCYEKLLPISKSVSGRQSAVAYKSKYWEKGYEIRVAFINGTDTQKEEFISVLEEYLQPLDLSWVYSDITTSEVRVSFSAGWGSYSYLGTDCRFIPKTEETLNIGWSGRAVMYHEIGHLLGLTHEHQSPNRDFEFILEEVRKDIGIRTLNNWTDEDIYYQVINKALAENVDATLFDMKSVMLYYFPNRWTKGNFETNENPVPSEMDLAFLLDKYGVTEQDLIAPVITLNGEQNQTVEYGTQYVDLGATAVDNKDGDVTDHIMVEGLIDTFESGLQYLLYSVQDSAGNVTEKTRTVLVKEQEKQGCLGFLSRLFKTEKQLAKLTEDQLLTICDELGIDATKEDLKKDTVIKVWQKISK